MRIEITLYYPAPVVLSEQASLLDDDLHQSKINSGHELTLKVDAQSSSAVGVSSQQPVSSIGRPSPPKTTDQGPGQVGVSSAGSSASPTRSKQTDKRQAGKKPRGAGAAGGVDDGGAAGGGVEEQVFNYVVQRFDDDVKGESAPPPPVVSDSQPKEERKSPPSKKKGQREVQTTEKQTDDVAVSAPISDSLLRRIAAERLWNTERSSTARCTVQHLNR